MVLVPATGGLTPRLAFALCLVLVSALVACERHRHDGPSEAAHNGAPARRATRGRGPLEVRQLLATSELGPAFDLLVQGDRMYLAHRGGLEVVDISSLQAPKVLQRIRSEQPFNDVVVARGYLFVTVGRRRTPTAFALRAYAIGGAGRLSEAAEGLLPKGLAPSVSARVLLRSAGSRLQPRTRAALARRLRSLSPSERQGVVDRWRKSFHEGAMGVQVDDRGIAYVGGFGTGVVLFDISQLPGRIVYRGRIAPRGGPPCPNAPAPVGHSWWFDVVGTKLFMPFDGAGFWVVDVADPTAPQPLGSFALSTTIGGKCHEYFFNDAKVEGGYAFIALDYGGLLVLDVSSPAHPRQVARAAPPAWEGRAWGKREGAAIQIGLLHVKGRRVAVLPADAAGVLFYEVTDPRHPVLIEQVPPVLGNAWGVYATEDRAFVASPYGPDGRHGGVAVYQLE